MDVFSYSRGHWPVLEPVPAVFRRMLGSPRTSHQFIVGGVGVPVEEPSDRENMLTVFFNSYSTHVKFDPFQ